MPAIQPARLKIQSAQLVEQFGNPTEFCRELHHLLGFYANRARRPGQVGEPPPLLSSYHVALPVLRQISQDLAPLIAEAAGAALALSAALWAEPWLEFRLLAAAVLGQVSTSQADAILARVNDWAGPRTEDRLLTALLTTGLAKLRQELPERYLAQVERWLNAPDPLAQQLGLRALLPLITDPAFENLPVLYRLITPLVRSVPALLRHDLLSVLRALARRSPAEAAFFLRQNLQMPESEHTAWLIRQSMAAFPPEVQASLRAALRAADRSND